MIYHSVRTKIGLSMLLILVLLLCATYIISQRIIMTGFETIEHEHNISNIGRIRESLNETINALDVKIIDWSQWDETYIYVQKPNRAFEETNLQPEFLANIQVNGMVFFDDSKKYISSWWADIPTKTALPIDQSIINFFSSHLDLLTFTDVNDEHHGIMTLNSIPVFFSSKAVTTSDATGPIKGSIILIRYLNSSELEHLKNLTNLSFSIYPSIRDVPDQVVQDNTSELTQDGRQIFVPINDNEAHVYTTIFDVYNNPAFYIKLTTVRTVYQHGKLSISYLLIAIGILGAVLLLFVVIVFGFVVLWPLDRLAKTVQLVGERHELSVRIPHVGRDELGILAGNINTMLDSLERYQKEEVTRTDELEKTKKELEERIQISEKQVHDMENTKKAVLNLLEDERGLEEALKSERDRIQIIVNAMGESLVVVDRNGIVTLVNPRAEQTVGLKQEAMVGKLWTECIELYKEEILISAQDRPITRSIATKTAIDISLDDNFFYKFHDGRKIPVGISITPIVVKDVINGAIILFRDITKDKEQKAIIEREVKERTRELVDKNLALEQAKVQISEGWLQQQKEKARLAASINSLTLGFIMTDAADHVVTINSAALKHLGLAHEVESLEVIEHQLKESIRLHDLHVKCQQEKKPNYVPSVSYNNKYLRFYLAPILMGDKKEELIGTVILMEDITEAKILERSRDEFFSIASHELRTPLTAIRGNTALIKQYYADKISDPDLKEMIEDIHASSTRLIMIVNDFLDMSRLEQGRMVFKKEQMDMADLIDNSVKTLTSMATDKNIALVFEKPTDAIPQTMGDPDKVKEVLFNLIGNAIKFTEKGSVTVKINDPSVHVPESCTGQLVVSVIDTGRGISMENQLLLFRKFQQAGGSLFTRDTTKGTGLGLYISKLIVEGMGGTVFLAHSAENSGSTFAFTLPVVK